jgi:HD-GYP domain-containing protein (c-di-GMP phosphodiesterase class II)
MVGTTHDGRAMAGWRRQLMGTMVACAGMIERKDSYTAGHVQRVTGFSVLLGMELKLSQKELTDLWLAAALHDVGKVFVNKAILGKPGPLTPRELELMKAHPEIGARMLSRVRGMRRAVGGVRHHHERYDGRGYPDRLRGTEIPLPARIIAVADTYDAMTSHRPYRAALSPREAALEITNEAGRQLCPSVVLAFQNLYEAGRFAPVP